VEEKQEPGGEGEEKIGEAVGKIKTIFLLNYRPDEGNAKREA